MLNRRFGPALPSLVLAVALGGCGGGGGAVQNGGAPSLATVRTLAYAPFECREDQTQRIVHQELRIERGEGTPVTVTDVTETFTQQPPLVFPGACRLAGTSRTGVSAIYGGGVQRLAVSPDGSTVVFEKTNRFSVLRAPQLAPDREGFFVVSADGSGLRPLGPPSRASVTRFAFDPSAPTGLRTQLDNALSFSADGRTIVFTDRGPDAAGEDATQIFTLDLFTGKRTQKTQLPPCAECNVNFFETGGPRYLPDGTIVFYTLTNPNGQNPENDYRIGTVEPDGTVTLTPPLLAQAGSTILPTFVITGDHPTSFDYGGPPCKEIYLLDHSELLQLTNFCRPDTFAGTQSIDGQRAFFVASADPFQTNPTMNCQIFSIDRLGTDLRQLTSFSQGGHSSVGCDSQAGPGPPGCAILVFAPRQDPATQALVFESSCDPFGINPNGGQVFAMNPDGTHLRQLTDTPGFTTEADGTVDVELPGPFASTAERR